MEGALRPSLLLLLLVSQPGGPGRAEASATGLSRIVGDSVTFHLEIPAEQVTTVSWTVNATRSIVTVVAGNPPNVIVTDPSYEGRLRVPESNSLQITSLWMEDTGTYGAQITIAPGTSTIHRAFLLRVYGPGRAGAGAMELSRIVGGSVTFPLGIPAEQLITVAWTVNTTRSLVTVVAGNPPNVIVSDASYEGRLRVPENNSLQITSLRMEDTGTYGAQITTATGTIHRLFPFLLRVYKQVPEPTVLCDSVTCVTETCNYNLRCTVRDGGDNVTYSWTHTAGGAVVPNGSTLHVSQRALAVTCTAQNPVSNSSTTASAKGLCAAPPPAPASSLSYCHLKGIVLLLVLGALSAGIIAVHVLPSRERRRD